MFDRKRAALPTRVLIVMKDDEEGWSTESERRCAPRMLVVMK